MEDVYWCLIVIFMFFLGMRFGAYLEWRQNDKKRMVK